MNKMKLLIIMIFLLSSCAYSKEDDIINSTIDISFSTNNKTEAVEKNINLYDNVVETMFEARNNLAGGSYGYDIRIPKVNISPKIDEIVNTDIQEIFFELAYPQEERGDALLQISYEYCINGDILSLLILEHSGMNIHSVVYMVNIDLKNELIFTLPYYLKQIGLKWLDIEHEVKINMPDYTGADSGLINYYADLDGMNFYLNKSNELNIVVSYVDSSPGADTVRYHKSYNVADKTTSSLYPQVDYMG